LRGILFLLFRVGLEVKPSGLLPVGGTMANSPRATRAKPPSPRPHGSTSARFAAQ
jgi:hypothetical protein